MQTWEMIRLDKFGVGIIGVGSALPDKVLTNQDLEKMVETSDEWIIKRTGISERRILDEDMPSYKLGIDAANRAIKNANIDPKDIDLIIVTTASPDYLAPTTACIIQNAIGAINASAFDMNAACSGFTYALDLSKKLIMSGGNKNILVVACEALSKTTDWKDRNTCVLFGDGSGAVIVSKVEENFGIMQTHTGADGSQSKVITIPGCFKDKEEKARRNNQDIISIVLDGSEVFKFAVKVMEQATLNVLEKEGISIEDVKMIVPHQANVRIIDAAAKRLGISTEKIYKNVDRFGNMSSATIPIALDEVLNQQKIVKGDYVVFVGFGGGLTWGSTLLKWH